MNNALRQVSGAEQVVAYAKECFWRLNLKRLSELPVQESAQDASVLFMPVRRVDVQLILNIIDARQGRADILFEAHYCLYPAEKERTISLCLCLSMQPRP